MDDRQDFLGLKNCSDSNNPYILFGKTDGTSDKQATHVEFGI